MNQFSKVFSIILAGILAILVFATRASCQVLANPSKPSQETNSWITVGIRFVPKKDATLTGARIHQDGKFIGWTRVYLWNSAGVKLHEAVVPNTIGWVTVPLPATTLKAGLEYTIGYSNENGWHYFEPYYFPKSFALYDAPKSVQVWNRGVFPTETAYQANYMIEPIMSQNIPTPPPSTGCDTVYVRDTIYITPVRDTIYIKDTVLAPVLCPDTTWVLVDGWDTVGARFPDWKIYGLFEFTMPLNNKVRFVRRIEAVWRREEFINGEWVEK